MKIKNAQMTFPITGPKHAEESVGNVVRNSPAAHVRRASVPPPKLQISFQSDVSDICPTLLTG